MRGDCECRDREEMQRAARPTARLRGMRFQQARPTSARSAIEKATSQASPASRATQEDQAASTPITASSPTVQSRARQRVHRQVVGSASQSTVPTQRDERRVEPELRPKDLPASRTKAQRRHRGEGEECELQEAGAQLQRGSQITRRRNQSVAASSARGRLRPAPGPARSDRSSRSVDARQATDIAANVAAMR
jgi:hypothetical protein